MLHGAVGYTAALAPPSWTTTSHAHAAAADERSLPNTDGMHKYHDMSPPSARPPSARYCHGVAALAPPHQAKTRCKPGGCDVTRTAATWARKHSSSRPLRCRQPSLSSCASLQWVSALHARSQCSNGVSLLNTNTVKEGGRAGRRENSSSQAAGAPRLERTS